MKALGLLGDSGCIIMHKKSKKAEAAKVINSNHIPDFLLITVKDDLGL